MTFGPYARRGSRHRPTLKISFNVALESSGHAYNPKYDIYTGKYLSNLAFVSPTVSLNSAAVAHPKLGLLEVARDRRAAELVDTIELILGTPILWQPAHALVALELLDDVAVIALSAIRPLAQIRPGDVLPVLKPGHDHCLEAMRYSVEEIWNHPEGEYRNIRYRIWDCDRH